MSERTLEAILTHEHTDFDALASMLGASIVYPDALPVLPRQLNRNVNEFLVLYKDELPFIMDSDMPKGRVKRAILVDADSVNWIKGMDKETELVIIDHHDDPTDAASVQATVDGQDRSATPAQDRSVGANTTLLVEQLMANEYAPTPVEATLLALGIHEDTGNLTYPSTTYRDARCLAWLMRPQNNVNQDVLLHFLNHPLSPAQRSLLHTLIDNSEFLDIAGHKVVIAQAEARSFRDELSALASRLRDFHETDAVFIIVNLGDILQVVARSTTDDIDVGVVATALGGGGHTRAAAAPIQAKGVTTQSVRDRVAGLVENSSRSQQTVGQIMSAGRPQIVPPDMQAREAAQLMQRYGHEGFPVVQIRKDGREELLGILTRRQIDRAMNHDYGDQPVRNFMRSGQVTVRPDDTVTTLRRRMVENNWGQVPVVDSAERIIGIVTRTDLIKLWDESALPMRKASEVEKRLRAKLPTAQYALLQLVGTEVDRLDYSVYVVGGFVRDLLLDQPRPKNIEPDVDIVIEGDAIEFANHMKAAYGGRVVPHQRFNTAKWLLDDSDYPIRRNLLMTHLSTLNGPVTSTSDLPGHLDFVTARTEFYTAPTVLPTVETSSIKLDLHRRDFTINTLAICLNPDHWGELLDFYGGLNDLQKKLIQVLHSLSFVDDPTRIVRAVRYEQRFGFAIASRTMELLVDALPLLDRVSGARIRHELERTLQEDKPERPLLRLAELGVLQRLDEHLTADGWVAARFMRLRMELARTGAPPALTQEPLDHLYWGLLCFRLPEETHTHLHERLGLRGAVQHLTSELFRIYSNLHVLARENALPSEIVAVLDKCGETAVALARVACFDQPIVVKWLSLYETELSQQRPAIDGRTLHQMGIPPGPLYSKILKQIRNAVLDGIIRGEEQEMTLARQIAFKARGGVDASSGESRLQNETSQGTVN